MRFSVLKIVSIIFASVLVANCGGGSDGGGGGGGGDGGGDTKPNLSGNYFGSIEQSGDMKTIEVTISGDQVTSAKFDGVESAYRATITNGTHLNTFGLADNTGGFGGFIRSTDGNHYAFVSESDTPGSFDIGILTRNATGPLPSFSLNDYEGSWTGTDITLTSDIDIVSYSAISTTVAPLAGGTTRAVSGTGLEGAFSGQLSGFTNATFGVVTSSVSDDSEDFSNANVTTIMSTDKMAVAQYACVDAQTTHSFNNCSFSIMEKTNPAVGTVTSSRMFNIEVIDTGSDPEIFQITLDGPFTAGANIPCSITHPYITNCSVDSYDETTNDMLISLSVKDLSAELTLTFETEGGIAAVLSIQSGEFVYFGGAKEVGTETRIRTQRDHAGAEYTVFSVLNPISKYQKAELIGTVSPIVLWDESDAGKLYVNRYNSYQQTDISNGLPQLVGAYVSTNSDAGNDSILYKSGGLQLVLSNHVNPANANLTLDVSYDNTRSPAELFGSMNPPTRADIQINGKLMGTADGIATAAGIIGAIYTITWPNTIVDTNVHWRLRLRKVNTSGIAVKYSEIRTPRMQAGAVGGPTLNMDSTTWSWTVPNEFVLPNSGIYKLNLRASNADHSLAGQSQSVFITRDISNVPQ